jgi:acyl-coenzyme A synthetase/AMP-(fatty) acid ligase
MPEARAPCRKTRLARFPPLASAIVQDDVRIGAGELTARATGLAARLREAGCGRVALRTDAAATVAVGLAASAEAGCEIALFRGEPAADHDLLGRLGAGALIDDDLALRSLEPTGTAPGAGFRVLIATSGTTGTPKLARHTLDRLTARIRGPAVRHGRGRWLLAYHPASFAGIQVLLTALISGDDLIAVSDARASALAEAALTHRPTLASGTPSFWRLFLIALGDRARELALEHITLGGEIADQATLDRLGCVFPRAAVTHIYASTEAGALFAVKDGRAGFPADWLKAPVDGAGLRIRDGLLEVESPRRMEGYVDAEEGSDAPGTGDGWLKTGDAVTRLGDRVLFLGRTDCVINVGGLKVSPEEVEAVLLEVEGVADAHVHGTKNAITGSLVTADVALETAQAPDRVREALIGHARDRLDPHKVPRVIRFVEAIELTRSGKKARVR